MSPQAPARIALPPQISDQDMELCMKELIGATYRHGESVRLGPFLRNLNEKLPQLDHRGRKWLLDRLVARHAMEIQQLDGY